MSRYHKEHCGWDFDWEEYIVDTENGRIDFDIDVVVDLLNQQDEKFKELERKSKLYAKEIAIGDLKIKQLENELANELDDHEKFVLIANDELQKLKAQNIELCTKLNMKEHEQAFCKLADRNCEYLGKVEKLEKGKKQLAIEELEKLRNEIITDQIDDGYTDKSVDLYYLTERITARINELRGEK